MLTYILLTITTVFLAWVMGHGLPQHRSQSAPAAEAVRMHRSEAVIRNAAEAVEGHSFMNSLRTAGNAGSHPGRPGNVAPHPVCQGNAEPHPERLENAGPTDKTETARCSETSFAGARKIRLQGDPRVSRAGFRRGVCLFGIFALLFTVSALRVGIGNDYYKYVEFINRITFDSYVPTEWGFNTLVKLCNILFGPENYMAVFAVIAAATLVIFLSALRHLSADFAVSFFLFMTLGFYFQTLNTIRYYLALAIVLWGLRFLVPPRRTVSVGAVCFHTAARESAAGAACDKAAEQESAVGAVCGQTAARPVRRTSGSIPETPGDAPGAVCFHPDHAGFIAAVLAAALFHKSALLAIPMYLLIIVPLKSRRATITTVTIVTLISAAICASALLFRDRYIDLVVLLYPSYANVGPLEGGTSLAGIARCVLALGLGGAALWRAQHLFAKHIGESSSIASGASVVKSSATDPTISVSGSAAVSRASVVKSSAADPTISTSESAADSSTSLAKLSAADPAISTSGSVAASGSSTAQSSTPLLKRFATESAEVNLNTSAARSSAAVSDFASAEAFPDDMALLKVCLLANYYALLLYLFFAFLPQISRLAYFLTVTQLLLVPEALAALLRMQTVAAESRSDASATPVFVSNPTAEPKACSEEAPRSDASAAPIFVSNPTAAPEASSEKVPRSDASAAPIFVSNPTAPEVSSEEAPRSDASQAAQAAPSGTTQEILRPAPHSAGASAHILPRPALALYAAVFLFGVAYFALFLKQASSDEIGIVPYQTWLFTEPRSYEGTWE